MYSPFYNVKLTTEILTHRGYSDKVFLALKDKEC